MNAIFFDLDGTLYQTELVAVPAFQRTFDQLQQEGLYTYATPSVSEIESVFGLTGYVFWQQLLPHADAAVRRYADELLLTHELALIDEGVGKFYPGVEEGLHQLHESGFQLFIMSNGIAPYVKAALDSQDLSRLFTELYTLGDELGVSKSEAVKAAIQKHQIMQAYMVGDRQSDMDAGRSNDLFTIGCKYTGFPYFGKAAELAMANAVISWFDELLQYVKKPV